MEGKLSSPASSSKGSSNQTPPKNGPGSRDDENYLLIQKQPPSYVFDGEPFEIVVGLELSRQHASPSEVAEISISLRIQNGDDGRDSIAQEVASIELLNETSPSVSINKPCKLRCKIQMKAPIQREKRLALSVLVSASNPSLGISPVYSRSIQVVNYKLRVSVDETWSNIWYKDEGGRDKSMEVSAELYGRDNSMPRERIPLRLTLFYAANEEGREPVKVTNQEVLRLLGNSSKLNTDKSTGKVTVRFRIEDVSKNHQGQDFLLQIAPDNRKGFWDIAPGLTPSVSVRSKRNKRARSTSIQGRSEKRSSVSPVHHGDSSVLSQGLEGTARNAFGQQDPSRLREAMQGIMHWTEEVVNGLYPLQWQILGYAQHPDGSPDYSQPHYSMTNPNACISRVLSTYHESIRENLWILSQAVEQTSSSQHPATGVESYTQRSPPDDSYSIAGVHRGQPHPAQIPVAHPTGYSPPGLYVPPAIASEAFRPKGATGGDHRQQMYPYQGMPQYGASARPQYMYPHQTIPQQYYRRPMPTQARRGMEDNDAAFTPEPLQPSTVGGGGTEPSPSMHEADRKPMARASFVHEDNNNDDSDQHGRESDVEYVLAKQHKSLRTGEILGFPAYSASREILGFYRESGNKVGVGEFVPISRHARDFGPMEIMQASEILSDAIAKKSKAVHALKDWGTISNLLDHALVYDWTKDIGTAGGRSTSHSGSDGE